jgi:hypothetical protein
MVEVIENVVYDTDYSAYIAEGGYPVHPIPVKKM